MVIGTCGFCSTGSSAVSDYLKEFNETSVPDGIEFTYAYLPDGLLDLEHHLTKCVSRDDSSAISIPRFRRLINSNANYIIANSKLSKNQLDSIVNDFINEIVPFRWRGSNRTDSQLFPGWFRRYVGSSLFSQRIIPFLNKRKHKCVDCYPYRNMDVSLYPENFIESARKFVDRMLEGMGADLSKIVVLDQPFPGNDPMQCFHFFGEAKAIIVDRDPRDNYIFAKEFLYKKGRFMPTNNVQEFVEYYKLVRRRNPANPDDERILRIHFEDMVYNYDNATKIIRDFCGLPDNPRPLSIFNPKLSIANTQLILRFPQYAEDVKYIEENLSEFLFDFTKYPTPDNSGKMFMGKSPLNK